MNKIISKIRVSELDTLSDVLVRLYKDSASDEASAFSKDANLSGIMTQIEKLSADITTAIKSDKTTSNLDEADIARDSVIRSLSDALNGYAAIPVPSRKAAAEKLLSVFNKYGKQIITKNYAEESSLIESMLEDFSAENLKADIESLEGISDLIAGLRSAQDSFNSANDAYTNASVNKTESASSIKKNLIGTLNDQLIPYLSAICALPAYKDFASKCESEIEKANSTVSGRTKKSAK